MTVITNPYLASTSLSTGADSNVPLAKWDAVNGKLMLSYPEPGDRRTWFPVGPEDELCWDWGAYQYGAQSFDRPVRSIFVYEDEPSPTVPTDDGRTWKPAIRVPLIAQGQPCVFFGSFDGGMAKNRLMQMRRRFERSDAAFEDLLPTYYQNGSETVSFTKGDYEAPLFEPTGRVVKRSDLFDTPRRSFPPPRQLMGGAPAQIAPTQGTGGAPAVPEAANDQQVPWDQPTGLATPGATRSQAEATDKLATALGKSPPKAPVTATPANDEVQRFRPAGNGRKPAGW
jgi:hypothetical protein